MTNRLEEFIKEIEQQGRDMELGTPFITTNPITDVSEANLWLTNAASVETVIFVGGGFSLFGSTVNLPNPITEMRLTIEKLEARVARLEEEIQLRKAAAQEEVIVLRTVSRERAKAEIRKLFSAGKTFYYSDVAQRLRLDLRLVVELCQELEEEGALEVDANYVDR